MSAMWDRADASDEELVEYARYVYGDPLADRLTKVLQEKSRFAEHVRDSFKREYRDPAKMAALVGLRDRRAGRLPEGDSEQ